MTKEQTLLLRNTNCSFTCPWANKLDGSDNHRFEKDEIFEVPVEIERERNGKKVMVSTLELLQKAFGKGIEEAKGAVSMKEKDEEIARLKAELAEAKKQKKSKKKTETEVVDEEVEETVETDDDPETKSVEE